MTYLRRIFDVQQSEGFIIGWVVSLLGSPAKKINKWSVELSRGLGEV
jgi:hypothetical protein